MSWYNFRDCLVFNSNNCKTKNSDKYALFDLDGTLIVEYKFFKYPNLILWFDKKRIFQLFQDFKKSGYIVAIITNSTNINQVKNVQKQMQAGLGWSPYFIINVSPLFLKPSPESFKLLCDLTELYEPTYSFYCGNEVGILDPFPEYRKSSIDSDFVKRVSSYTNIELIRPLDLIGFKQAQPKTVNSRSQEIIITLGMPGSGKSTMAYKFKRDYGYEVCDIDELNWSRKEALECTEANIINGKSVIFVGVNATEAKRQEIINLANKYKISYRILFFIRDGREFNKLRGTEEDSSFTTYKHLQPVKNKVFIDYFKDFELPIKYEEIF